MAYAALISLRRTTERLINIINPQISTSAQLELKLLEDVLKRLDRSTNISVNMSVINELDAEIREAVWKLEDALQSYALHPTLLLSDSLDEARVMEEMYLFSVTMKMLEDEYMRELDDPISGAEDAAASPINLFGGEKSTMVGFLDEFEMLRDKLLDWRSDPKTVSLFGMAGIGKTRLAEEIYKLPLIVEQFDIRVWVALGPKHDLKNVLVDIVSQIERLPRDLHMEEDTSDLGLRIYQKLCGQKYLIVLDDIWSTQAWDDLKMWFPAEADRSRLLLTTRLEEVAEYPTKCYLHRMRLFKHEESWNLLCQNVFSHGETCPFQLERPLRKIAERCEGLPLLVLQVAHGLSGAEKTLEYWNEVADNPSAVFSNAYERISEVLLLSFKYLPQYLKACFLYMGAFPQNYEIPLTKLINLWTVEDFLESNQSDQSLDDFAIECFKMLVSHSLAIVCKHSSNYRYKSSKLHSTYWHLCVIEAMKNKFLHVLGYQAIGYEEYMKGYRRLSVRNSVLFGIKEVSSSMVPFSVRSLLFTGEDHQYPVDISSDFMLLKVLDSLAIRFYEFPDEVLKLLQLKYLALTHNGSLPSSISKLEQLQCLILRRRCNTKLLDDQNCLPEEIWNLQELKHLRIKGSNLPNPSDRAQLPNLLTLHVKGHSCTEDVFNSIPKLKKLGIKIELEPRSNEILNCFEHIAILHELESLKCVVVNPRLRSQVVAPPRNFPTGLKKLSLHGLGYSWNDMSAISLLPNLQVLKLRRHAFQGPEWETKGEEFPKLEFLLLEDMDLEQWTVDDDDCFVSLRHLIVRHCYKLEEIPSQVGAIPALEMIEVVDCSPSVVASAQQIQIEEEEEYGNSDLQVPISSSWDLCRKRESKK